ncbi:MAG TPA: thiamine pyrophosphate-binding protein, partial [Armatimonadota bacterium]|nr:thiamine pyrophosphate-binding protein [Armatimonadota bacterium]
MVPTRTYIKTERYPHRMIPAPQTLADTLVTQLIDAGIDTVFGIPGLYNMPLFDALRRAEGIRVVTVRHEQGAAFMADGYARATGRPAAICLLPGCGVLNAMTGISEAFFDSSPMLVLASQVATEHIDQDRGLLHELTGQLDVVGSVTKHSVRLTDVESAPAVFADALRRLRTGRPRPVQVEIPLDLQSADVSGRPEPTGPADATGRLDHDLIRRAAANLAAASRPLIYVGGGAVDAASITDIAEHLGAPTFTTGMGVGALPGDHPLWAGVPWVASGDIRPLFEASDCVLFVGTRLNHGMTAEWGIGAPAGSVRIDVDPVEITKTLDVDVQIVADAAAATEALLTELRRLGPAKGPSAEMAALLEQRRAALAGRVGTTTPWFEALRSALPADGIIAADMSLFWGDMIGSFPVAGPRQILFPWGMGTLGFGVPSALGA